MTSETKLSSRLGLVAAAAFTLALGAALPAPALALDDDGAENVFSAVLGLVGVSAPKEQPNIEYRERPPLVVPSNRAALPQPQAPAAKRNASWPKDQEIARREKAEELKRKPRVDEVQNPVSRTELDRVRTAGGQPAAAPVDPSCNEPLGRPCNQEAFWTGLRNARSSSDEDKVPLTPGKESSRQWLTDPPTGYRKPTTVQKYTFEMKKEVDITDARAQAIDERQRRDAN